MFRFFANLNRTPAPAPIGPMIGPSSRLVLPVSDVPPTRMSEWARRAPAGQGPNG